jgi:NifU-like protein involved in Fe-S cluster formation
MGVSGFTTASIARLLGFSNCTRDQSGWTTFAAVDFLVPPLYIGVIMLNDIYNRRILALAADIPHLGRLADPDASATAHSKLCGSTVTIDLKLADGVVTDFAHEVKACALGQASASIMARHIIGSTPAELRALRERMRAMLKENGPVPEGKWSDCAVLEPVRDYKARHASTLLTFDAVVSALDEIDNKKAA